MIKSFFASDDAEVEERTGIDWLDTAIALALYLINEYNGRLAESGKATVLKTADTSQAYMGSNPISSAIDE